MPDDNFFDATNAAPVAPIDPWPEEPPPANSIDDYGDTVIPFRKPVKANATFAPTALATRDLSNIPPRRWLYGHELIRGFVSILASPGGVGKSAYTIPVGLSVALNRALLCDDPTAPPRHAKVHAQGAVWFYNLEDPLVEMDRRIVAALIEHDIPQDDVDHVVYVDSGRTTPLCIGVRNRQGELEVWPNTDVLVETLIQRGIALLIIDPFVHSHDGKENDNGEMAKMIAEWAKVAEFADCAVWLVHHFRKGGAGGGDPDAIRGAAAIVGAVRSAWTVSTMTVEEAREMNVPENQRGYFFRHDNAKQNMAPPIAQADWFELRSVPLDNGTEEYPEGDHVQAVRAWRPVSPWSDLPMHLIVRVLEALDKGPGAGEQYYLTGGTGERWAGRVLMSEAKRTEEQAKVILSSWKKSGLITPSQYPNPKNASKQVQGLTINGMKFSEMKQQMAPPASEEP